MSENSERQGTIPMQKPKAAPPAPDRAIFQREGSASQPVPIEIPKKNEETEVIAHFRLVWRRTWDSNHAMILKTA